MEFSIKLYAIKSGLSIVYNEGSQVIIQKIFYFLSLEIYFVLANSADQDGSSLFAKVPFCGFPIFKELKEVNRDSQAIHYYTATNPAPSSHTQVGLNFLFHNFESKI